jgi:RHS repeat-associated protein
MGNKTGIEKYRRGLEEENGNYQFTYDALARLTKVDKDDKLIRAYGYDEYGNRSFIIEKGVRIDYMYNSLNQLLRTETGRRTQSFSYDARGNLTQVRENDRLKNTYEFGPINLLTRAVAADGRVANYEYNGLRHRVGKQITNNLSPIKNINYALDLTRQYNNLLQITEDEQDKNYLWDFNLVAESVGGNNRFYLQDELGSPLRVSYDDCSLMDSYAYDEFGNDLTGNQGVMQPFGYTGYRYDDVTQTYFAQAREYNPYTGRFNSVDIIKGNIHKPFSLNEYIYCGNNPQTYIDLTGLEQVVISGGIYSNEKREADAYYYEFIDAGLARVSQL